MVPAGVPWAAAAMGSNRRARAAAHHLIISYATREELRNRVYTSTTRLVINCGICGVPLPLPPS